MNVPPPLARHEHSIPGDALHKKSGIPPTAVGGWFKSFLQPNPMLRFYPAHGSGRILQVLPIYLKSEVVDE